MRRGLQVLVVSGLLICAGRDGSASSYPQPLAVGAAGHFAVADFNRDGSLDIVAREGALDAIAIHETTIEGDYALAGIYAVGSDPVAFVAGDFNADGWTDVAVANRLSGDISVLLATGSGAFSPETRIPLGPLPYDLEAADLNGDGTLDLAVAARTADSGSAQGRVVILLGAGDGSFSILSAFQMGNLLSSVTREDFNGDSATDLAITDQVIGFERRGTVYILIGTGTGAFSRSTLTPGAQPVGVRVADFNGDGLKDLAVANAGRPFVGEIFLPAGPSIFLGDGGGGFGPRIDINTVTTTVASLDSADLNGDGREDLVLAEHFGSCRTDIRLGNGNGTFGAPLAMSLPGASCLSYDPSVALRDFSGDGSLDLAVSYFLNPVGSPVVAVFASAGDGTFHSNPVLPARTGAPIGGRAIADVNSDGHEDLVLPSATSDRQLSIHLGHGDGTFEAPASFEAAVTLDAILAADLDLDGTIDLAVADRGAAAVNVFVGRGDGTFDSVDVLPVSSPKGVVAGDFNRDGRIDLVTIGPPEIHLGLGDGTFAPATPLPSPPGNNVRSVAVADLDGDDDLDLALTDQAGIWVYPGAGDGSFSPATLHPKPPSIELVDIAIDDFNSDGRQDLIASTLTGPILILLGIGDGTFAPAGIIPRRRSLESFEITAGDFNADGRRDIAVASFAGWLTVLRGNGDGTFAPEVDFLTGMALGLMAGDLNEDGLPDFVVSVGPAALVFHTVDADGDGITDAIDNCPAVPNHGQEDADGDSIGDACDTCPNDSDNDVDGDGVCGNLDNCPTVANTNQADADADALGDACDTCPNDSDNDVDGDGVCGNLDTCPTVANPDGNPCACNACYPLVITISFQTEIGRGAGLIQWRTGIEHDISGFNIVVIDNHGNRLQQNSVLIPCEECVTDRGSDYAYPIPKHRGGHNVFVEQVRRDGQTTLHGPAVKD